MTDITIEQKVEWLRKMRDDVGAELRAAGSLGYSEEAAELKIEIEVVESILADYRKQPDKGEGEG